jgi:hypothetical protein
MAGEQVDPPEDCGGLCGYEEMLKNSKHRENEHYREWFD